MCEPGQRESDQRESDQRESGQRPGGYASIGQALAAAEAALAFVARADAASVPVEVLAGGLRVLERVQSAHTAAQARVLGAFTAHGGPDIDGHGSVAAWLKWRTRVTRGAAAGAVGWMRRLSSHPQVAAALARGQVSQSWAREICGWSDRLPEDRRPDADRILLAAAAGGAALADLSGLAEEMFRRSAPPDGDDDGKGFNDRSVRLDLHYQGAGKLAGDLTPECAAALTAVLEALGKKAGPEDDRTQRQRDHDALEEAMRRLVASGCLPDRAGQPTLIQLHMTLDQLRSLEGAADAEAAWAAGRAAGNGEPGWVQDRATAEGYACDARMSPVVSGHVDPAALAALTSAFLTGHQPGCTCGRCTSPPPSLPSPAGELPRKTLARLRDTLLWYAADVLSGPAGLAAFLRTGLLAAEFPRSVSLPLDVGAAVNTVPPYLRHQVINRDRHCAAPGCQQHPSACHVHHIVPRSKGGKTCLTNLILLCPFHHLIAVHQWGWSIRLNADGTTIAISPDGQRTLHSHGPPETTAA